MTTALSQQIEIATLAMFDLLYRKRIGHKTLRRAEAAGVSEPRLRAMARFIETKGTPRQFDDLPE